MFNRHSLLVSSMAVRGRPYRRRNKFQPIHASQRPAAAVDIDFNALDLKYKPAENTEFTIPKIGWSPPPAQRPNLPFHVRTSVLLYLSRFRDAIVCTGGSHCGRLMPTCIHGL
jgi:hypothetical protein